MPLIDVIHMWCVSVAAAPVEPEPVAAGQCGRARGRAEEGAARITKRCGAVRKPERTDGITQKQHERVLWNSVTRTI